MAALTGPRMIKVANIKTTIYVRRHLDEDHVLELADLYLHGAKIDPIIVNVNMELIEGRHRLEALRLNDAIETPCLISTTTNMREMIYDAVRENIKGKLPPTIADLQHSIELLMQNGATLKEIRDSFPLPQSLITKYIKSIQSNRARTLVGKAVDLVTVKGYTIPKAAAELGVPEDDLKSLFKKRSKQVGAPLAQTMKSIAFRARGLSQAMSRGTRKIMDDVEAGVLGQKEVDRYFVSVHDTMLRLARTAKRLEERYRKAPTMGDITVIVKGGKE